MQLHQGCRNNIELRRFSVWTAGALFLLPWVTYSFGISPQVQQQLLRYRILQANVDYAFLRVYLHQNGAKVSPSSERIREIGARISRATGNSFFFSCHFYWIRDNVANAITSPKGNIFFYQGLNRLKLTDAETAAIIAHEVGHLTRAHWLARLQRSIQARVLAQYTAKMYGRNSAQIAYLAKFIQNLQYNQTEEYEADAIGAQLLVNAGYPPEALVSVLGKLDADMRRHPPKNLKRGGLYLSDHPLTPDRIARLNQIIPTLKPIRKRLF